MVSCSEAALSTASAASVVETHVISCCVIFVLFCVCLVDEGAIVDVQFNHFYHDPPEGFEEIMVEKSLL